MKKLKRRVSTQLVWKCRGGSGQHHSYYNLHSVTAAKLEKGKVSLYFHIEEADDGESVPTENSRAELQRMRERLEKLKENGTFESLEADDTYAWPRRLKIIFSLRNEHFLQGSLAMCLRILDVLQATPPDPAQVIMDHQILLEVEPGIYVPESSWVIRQAKEALRLHREKK